MSIYGVEGLMAGTYANERCVICGKLIKQKDVYLIQRANVVRRHTNNEVYVRRSGGAHGRALAHQSCMESRLLRSRVTGDEKTIRLPGL